MMKVTQEIDNLKQQLDLTANQFTELDSIVKNLARAFIDLDASTIEINPLVLNREGDFVLLDVKLSGINFCYFTQLLLNEIFVNYLYDKIYTFDKHESIFSI